MKKRTELDRAIFESGYTQRELAKMVGMNHCVLSMVRAGTRRLKLEQSLRLAKILNRDPEEIGLIGLSSLGGFNDHHCRRETKEI